MLAAQGVEAAPSPSRPGPGRRRPAGNARTRGSCTAGAVAARRCRPAPCRRAGPRARQRTGGSRPVPRPGWPESPHPRRRSCCSSRALPTRSRRSDQSSQPPARTVSRVSGVIGDEGVAAAVRQLRPALSGQHELGPALRELAEGRVEQHGDPRPAPRPAGCRRAARPARSTPAAAARRPRRPRPAGGAAARRSERRAGPPERPACGWPGSRPASRYQLSCQARRYAAAGGSRTVGWPPMAWAHRARSVRCRYR